MRQTSIQASLGRHLRTSASILRLKHGAENFDTKLKHVTENLCNCWRWKWKWFLVGNSFDSSNQFHFQPPSDHKCLYKARLDFSWIPMPLPLSQQPTQSKQSLILQYTYIILIGHGRHLFNFRVKLSQAHFLCLLSHFRRRHPIFASAITLNHQLSTLTQLPESSPQLFSLVPLSRRLSSSLLHFLLLRPLLPSLLL